MTSSYRLSALLLGCATVLFALGCGQVYGESEPDTSAPTQAHAEQGHAMAAASADAASDAPSKANDVPSHVPGAYPLKTCVVSGAKLGTMGKPVTLTHQGREVRLCCPACEPKFKADPDAFMKKIDDAVVAEQLPSYPMTTCVISGDELGDKPINYVYENRLVRFCCAMCIDTFLKDPDAALSKLDAAAVKTQLPDYPAKTCPVTGEKLGSMGKPVDLMVGDKLVRLCCKGCIEKVRKDPAGALEKVYPKPANTDAE